MHPILWVITAIFRKHVFINDDLFAKKLQVYSCSDQINMNLTQNNDKVKAQQIEAQVFSMLKLQEYFPQVKKRSIEAQLKEQFRAFQAIIDRQPLQNTEVQREANLLVKNKCYQSLLSLPQSEEYGRNMSCEERQEEKNPIFQTQQWQEVQSQLVAEYKLKSIEEFTSQEQNKSLAKHLDFIKQKHLKSADCKQILSKISKNIVIAQLFFNETKLKAKKMGISAKWHQQFQKQIRFLEESYENELTQLQSIAIKLSKQLGQSKKHLTASPCKHQASDRNSSALPTKVGSFSVAQTTSR